MPGVRFNGEESLILVLPGVRTLDAQVDLYSDWKEFAVTGSNLKFVEAIRTVGGDSIRPGRDLGDTYFITNGWQIRPSAENQQLIIEGNFYPEAGEEVFNTATGTVTVATAIERAIDTFREDVEIAVSVSGTLDGLDSVRIRELHRVHGLQTGTPLFVTDTVRSAGSGVNQEILENFPESGSVTVRRLIP